MTGITSVIELRRSTLIFDFLSFVAPWPVSTSIQWFLQPLSPTSSTTAVVHYEISHYIISIEVKYNSRYYGTKHNSESEWIVPNLPCICNLFAPLTIENCLKVLPGAIFFNFQQMAQSLADTRVRCSTVDK